jgi:hypothetical protein
MLTPEDMNTIGKTRGVRPVIHTHEGLLCTVTERGYARLERAGWRVTPCGPRHAVVSKRDAALEPTYIISKGRTL